MAHFVDRIKPCEVLQRRFRDSIGDSVEFPLRAELLLRFEAATSPSLLSILGRLFNAGYCETSRGAGSPVWAAGAAPGAARSVS